MAVGKKIKFLIVLLIFFGVNNVWAQIPQCPTSESDVTYNNEPDPACESVSIDANSGWDGYWIAVTSGLWFDNSDDPTTTVHGLHYPVDTVVWYNDNNTSTTSDDCVDTLIIYSNYIAAFAGNDTAGCSSITLNANNVSPGIGTWSVESAASGVTFSNPNDPTATASNIPIGQWEFYWSVTYDDGTTSCSDKDTVLVTNNTPYPVDAGVDDTTCVGDSIQLAATPPPIGASGKWTQIQGLGIIKDDTYYNTWVTDLGPGENVFRWEVTNGTCSDADTVHIYNYTVHLTDNTPSATTCRESGTISVTTDPNDITGYWEVVSSTATINSSTDLSTTVQGLNPGANTFKFVVKDYNGCSDSIEVSITASDVSATASTSASIVCEDSVGLIGNTPPSGGSGQWIVLSGSGTVNDATSNSTYATGLTKTYNQFVWEVTDAIGCKDRDTVEVSYEAPDEAVISTPDHGVCTDTVNLGAIAPSYGTGYWTGPSGVTFNPDNSQTVLYAGNLNSGVNELVWHVVTSSCPEKTDTVRITYTEVSATASASASAVCNDTVYLTGNDPSAFGGTGVWSVLQGNGTFDNANSYSTFVTNLSPTVVNKFVWTVSNGTCSDADTVEVTYGGADVAIIADDTLYSCDGTINVNANTPSYGSAYWTATAGVNFSPSSTDNNITASNLSVGSNILVWHVVNSSSCPENTDTVVVIYEDLYADAGGPYSHTCNGSINLAAGMTAGALGTWSGAGVTFSDVHDPNATVSNLSFGANTLTWTVSKNGCSVWDTITVYNDAADPAIAGLDQHVCSNEATLSANAITNGTGEWTTPTSAIIDNSTNNVTLVYNLDPGGNQFIWTVTNGTCSTSDTVIIYNDSVSVADAGNYQYICKDSAVLNANTPTLGVGQWSIISGSGNFDDPTSANTTIRNLGRGQNILQWRIYNPSNPSGCYTTDTVNIYNMSVNASFPLDPMVTCEDTAVIDASNPATQDLPGYPANGYWSSLSGLVTFDNSNSPHTTARNLQLDTNLVTWTIYNGVCQDVDTAAIVNNNPGPIEAGNDTVICFTEYDLKATPPTRGTGHWYVLGGGGTVVDPTNPNSHVTDLEYYCRDTTPEWWTTVNAVNILEWTVTYNGCTVRDTVRIINGKPGIVDAGDDTTVCNTTVNLYAKDLGSCAQQHWWTADPAAGLTFYDPATGNVDNTDFNAHVEGLQAGITSFYWHKRNVINGITCELVDTVQITSLNLNADINAGPDDAVCDTNYTLNATPPSNAIVNSGDVVRGFWTVLYGSGTFIGDSSTAYDATVHNLGFQTNVLRWTVVNETKGCVATDDLYLTNALPSNAFVFSNDTVVCNNEANLVANRPVRGTGEWQVIGGTATLTNSTCQEWYCSTYAQDLQSGLNTFLWVVTNVYKGPGVADSLVCTLQDTAFIFYNEVVANAGDTMYQCADTAHLHANLPTANPPYVGQWSVTSGTGTFATTSTSTSNNPNDTILGLNYGKNTLTWTLSRTINGVTCSNSDQIIVWNNLPPDPYAGVDQVVCEDSAHLIANTDTRDASYDGGNEVATTTHYWTSVSGGQTFEDSNNPNTWVYNLAPQQYNELVWNKVLHFTDNLHSYTQECKLTDTVRIYNNAVTAVAGSIPGIICGDQDTGAYVVLNATDPHPLTGHWYFISGSGTPTIVDPTNFTTPVRNLDNGANKFSWVVENTVDGTTCSTSDTVTVEVRIPTRSVVATPDSFEVCDNSAPLQANEPVNGVGHWEAVSPYSGDIVNSTAVTTTVNNLWRDKTKWVWVIDNDGCVSRDTITVINNYVYADASTIDPNNMDSVCVDTFQLSANDPNDFNTSSSVNLAIGQWTTGGSAVFDQSTAYNTIVRNLSNSDPNVLVWTITKGGCSASSQITIYDNEFTIDAYVGGPSPNTMTTCDDSIQLDAQQPGTGGHGQWNKIGGGGLFKDDTLYNTWVTNLSTTDPNIFVWVVSRNGCTARDTVTVISNKVTSQAGADKIVCYDTTTLDAGLPPSGATGTWLNDLGAGTFADPHNPKTHVSGMANGVNTFIWRIEKGSCSAQDTVKIINNEPEDAVAEADKEVCSNSTTLVVDNPPASDTGYWSLLTGAGTIADSTSFNAPVTGLQPGVNKFVWTVYRGSCTKKDTLVITNNEVAANAGLDDTVCSDTAKIAALGPSQFYPYQGTGLWSDAGGTGVVFDQATDSVTIVRNLRPGNNTLRWTVTKGSCSAYDDIVITNRAVLASATDIAECNFPVTLTGNDPVADSGLWKNIGGLGVIADPTLYNSSFTGLDYGLTTTLRWIVYNESCADSVDISVTNNNFSVQAGPDQAQCADTALMHAQLPGTGAIGTWSIDAGNGTFVDIHDPLTTVRDLANGTNIFRWTVDYNGCTNSDVVSITNNLPSEAVITNIAAACDSTASLSANQPSPYYADNQYWTILGPHTFTSDSTDFNATVSDLDPGQTTVLWVIENNGCSDIDTGLIINDAVAAYAGDDQSICDSFTVIQALDPLSNPPYQGTGTWTANKPVTISNQNDPITNVSGLPIGATTFTWTVTKGSCSASDQLTVYNAQTFASAYDTVTCTDSAYLVGNDPYISGGKGKWTVISGTYTSIKDDTLPNTVIYGLNYNSTTTIEWYVTNGTCDARDTITVISNNFYISAGINDTICFDYINLKASDYDYPADSVWWQVVGGNGVFDQTDTNITVVRNLNPGVNTLRWNVIHNGCQNYSDLVIVNNEPSDPDILTTNDTVVCDGQISLRANAPSEGSGYWVQIAGSGLADTATDNIITVSGLSQDNNIFRWTVEKGSCSKSADVTVINNQVVANAGLDDTTCSDTYTMLATAPITGATGVWNDESGVGVVFGDIHDPNTIVTLPQQTTVTLSWTVTKGGCSDVDYVKISNLGVMASASDASDCDTSINILGNDTASFILSPTHGRWSIVSGPSSIWIEDSTKPSTVLNGLPFGTSAILQWKLYNDYGCVDSVPISVANNGFTVDADINGNDITVCQDTYRLHGTDPVPGTGEWTVVGGPGYLVNTTSNITTVYGLTSSATVLRWHVYKNGCDAYDDVYVTNGFIPAQVVDANPSACGDVVSLNALDPSPGSGYWRKATYPSAGVIADSTNYNTQISGVPISGSVGLYWVVESNIGGCTDSILVTAFNKNFPLSAGNDKPICVDTFKLEAQAISGADTSYWTVASGNGVFDDTTLATTVVRDLQQGPNVFVWHVEKNGCEVTDDVVITNNSVTADAGPDQLDLCVDYTTLNGNDPSTFGGTGYWTVQSGDGNFVDSTLYNTDVTNLRRGTNTFRWTVEANGCDDYDDVVIVNNSFDVDAGLDDPTHCADTVLLQAKYIEGGIGHWTVQGSSPAIFDDSDSSTTIARNLQQGANTFRWTVTKNGCTFYDDVVITNLLPNAPVILLPNENPDTVCVDSVFLQAQTPEAGVTGSWSYVGSGGTILHPNSDTTTVINLNPGATEFVWTVNHNGCPLSTSIVVVNGSITANAGADQTQLCQDNTSLAAVVPDAPAYGWWTKADGQPGIIAESTNANTEVINLGYGENLFVWNVKRGRCSATDTVKIINNSASPAVVNPVDPTCDGTAWLTATAPTYGTGSWSYVGTYPVNIVSPNSANTQVTNLEYGANMFKWTVTNTTPYTTCTNDTSLIVLNYEFSVDAGNYPAQCDSTFYLNATNRTDADSSKWIVVTGNPTIVDSTDANTTVYLQQGTSAILKWAVWEHGCYAEDLATLQNKAVTAIAYDKEVCDTTVNLSAVDPGVGNLGYWSAAYNDIWFDPDSSQYNAIANGLHVGANNFIWHVYNDRCSDSAIITVNYLVPFADAGPDQAICNDYYTLSANDPSLYSGTGEWTVFSGSGVFDNSTVYNTTVRNLDTGANVLMWTVHLRGCSNTDMVVITNNKPYISVGGEQNICDTFTTLSASPLQPGETGYWSKVTPGPHWIVDSTNSTTLVYGIRPGSEVFRWTVEKAGCSATADVVVNNNSVIADPGLDREICADSAQLSASLPSNSTGYWEVVTPGPEIVDSTLYNTWVRNLNFGDNTFRWNVHHINCDASALVTITNIAPPVDAGTDQVICDNQTTLYGSMPPDTAHGVWRLIGGYANITDSTANVTTVSDLGPGANLFTWTVYNGPNCYNTDEVIITNKKLPVEGGADAPTLCSNEYQLNANPPDSGAIGYWTVVSGYGEFDNSDSNITWVRNLARGENILRWTVSKDGCDSYDEVFINNITPTQAITIGEKIVCEDYTTITGNEPTHGLGYWKVVTSSGAVVIDDTLANSTVVRNLASGPNQFAWIIVDTTTGCATSDTVTVYNNSVVASAGLDREICIDTFELEATDPSPNTGFWTIITPGGNIDASDINNPNAVVRNLSTGANILRWTVYNSYCSAFDDVIITNNEPTDPYAGEDQISCDGSAILLGNTPELDEQGLWIRQSGDGIIADPTSYYTNVTGLSAGVNTFIWQISRGTCSKTDTMYIDNHNILVYAGEDQPVCNIDTAVIRGNPPTTGVIGYWTLTGGQGDIVNSTDYQTVVRNLGPGGNTFRWTLSDGVCTNYDEVVVTNNTPTTPNVCDDTVTLCTDSTTLCANSPFGIEVGYWSIGSGNADFDNSNSPTTKVYNLSREVTLIWHISKNGCEKRDTMYIVNGSVDASTVDDTLAFCGTEGYLAANQPIDTNAVAYWELISGSGNIADSTAHYTTVSNLGLGANIFRWNVANDKCSGYSDVVVFNNKYPASANIAATNPICDSSVVVMGNPPIAGAIGQWSVASGLSTITFDSPNSPTTVARNLGAGTTILKWSVIKDGCENYDTVVVINHSVYANAGVDITVCDTDEVASLIANDPANVNALYGYWSIISGSVTIANTTNYSTTVTDVAYGANTLKWTVVGDGCQDEDVVIVSNNHFTVSAGSDFTVCDTTAILTGTDPGPGGTGLWTVSGSGWFEDPTNYITRVNGIIGSNTYVWTVHKNGCIASDAVVVTNGTPEAFAGGDIPICEDTFQLKASVPNLGTGTWTIVSGGGIIDNVNDPHSVVRNLPKGDNILRWTVQNGSCSAYDDVVITNNMVTATAGIDQAVCDTVVYLAADPPGPGGYGIWTIDAGGGTFVDSTLYNTAVWGVYDGINTYRWTVYENGCHNSTTVKVTNNRFSVSAGKDTVVFVPSTTLSADVWSSNPPYSGTWSIIAGGGVFADATDPNTDVNNLAYGVNTYRWYVTNSLTGCSAYDDVNVTYSGFSVDAGADQIVCKDSTIMNAQEVPYATAYWSVVQGGGIFEDPTNPSSKVTDLARGVNVFRWNVIKNGFATYDEVTISNYAFDTYAGENQDLCVDSTYLNAEYMYNYSIPVNPSDIHAEWQILSGGGNVVDPSANQTSITDLNPDANIIRWYVERTDYPGTGVCSASDTVTLYYYRLPPTDFATSPDVPEGCSPLYVEFYNRTPTFDTIPGTKYYWNIANSALIQANYSDTIRRTFINSSPRDSIYPIWLIAEVEVSPGIVCRDTAYREVTVLPVPNVGFTAPIYSVYTLGFELPIEVTRETCRDCDRYQWDFGDGTGVVSSVLDSAFTHPYNTWGTYTISLSAWRSQCSNSYSLTVHIEPPEPVAEPNSSNDAKGCAPLTVPLYAQVLYTTDGVSQYRWVIKRARDSAVIAELHDKDVYYTFTEPGTYWVDLWVTAEGTVPEPWSWAFIRTDTIVVYPKPVADFTVAPMEATVGELVKCYNYSKGAVRYYWNFGYPDSSMTSTEFEPTVAYPKEGEYYITLRVESDHYCTDQKTMDQPVVIIPEGELIFPDAFIPTSTVELNRVFKPRYRGEVIEYELQVYNRWGQLVFVSDDIDVGWDGRINGQLAPQDVYAYKARVKFRTGIEKTYSGSVTLLR